MKISQSHFAVGLLILGAASIGACGQSGWMRRRESPPDSVTVAIQSKGYVGCFGTADDLDAEWGYGPPRIVRLGKGQALDLTWQPFTGALAAVYAPAVEGSAKLDTIFSADSARLTSMAGPLWLWTDPAPINLHDNPSAIGRPVSLGRERVGFISSRQLHWLMLVDEPPRSGRSAPLPSHIEGMVVDSATNQPIRFPERYGNVWRDHGRVHVAWSWPLSAADSSGHFRIDGVPQGVAQINVYAPFHEFRRLRVRVPSDSLVIRLGLRRKRSPYEPPNASRTAPLEDWTVRSPE